MPAPSHVPAEQGVPAPRGGNEQLVPEQVFDVHSFPSLHAVHPDVTVSDPTTVNEQLVPLQE